MSARISSRLSSSPMLLAQDLLRRILSFPAAGNQLFEPDNNGQDGKDDKFGRFFEKQDQAREEAGLYRDGRRAAGDQRGQTVFRELVARAIFGVALALFVGIVGQEGLVGRHGSTQFFRIDDQIDLHHAFATEQTRVVVDDRTAFAFAANGPLQIVRLFVVARWYFPTGDVKRRRAHFLTIFVRRLGALLDRLQQFVGLELVFVVVLDVTHIRKYKNEKPNKR